MTDVSQSAVDRLLATLQPGALGVVNDASNPQDTDTLAARIRGEWGYRLGVRLPATDGLVARLLSFDPQTGNRMLPALQMLGRRGRAAHLKHTSARS